MTPRRSLACLLFGHNEQTLYAPTNTKTKPLYRPEAWCFRCRRKLRDGLAASAAKEVRMRQFMVRAALVLLFLAAAVASTLYLASAWDEEAAWSRRWATGEHGR